MLATPIGNLRDITLRALDVLSAVDLVAAEDTRITRHLLAHYGINAKIVSLREHNEAREAQRLVALMQQGQSIALVTDAGTPGISDPGSIFVGKARAAGVGVWPIPGPSAVVCALSVLGWDAGSFSFHGFLPSRGRERREILGKLKALAGVIVLFEAPHRIVETLRDLAEACGEVRPCAVFRELTKKFEESKAGSLAEVLAWIQEDENHQRGEFVLVLEGAQPEKSVPSLDTARLVELLCEKLPTKEAVRIATEISGEKRNDLYEMALKYKTTPSPRSLSDLG